MTSVKLQDYLSQIGIFSHENVYMVEVIDGTMYNRVPTNYKCKVNYLFLNIKLFRNKYGDNDIYIDFDISGVNLYSRHKLNELTLPTLIEELDKMLISIPVYKEWRLVCLKDYKISNLL